MSLTTDSARRELSARETEILELAANGVTDKEIAANCGISSGTVHTHWNRIYSKMGAANRAEAVSVYVGRRSEQKLAEMEAQLAAAAGEAGSRQEEQLSLSRDHELLRSVVAGAPCVLWAVDREGGLLLVAGAESHAMGFAPDDKEKTARFLSAVVSPDELARVIAGNDFTSVRRVGSAWLRTKMSPTVGPSGQAAMAVGVTTELGGEPAVQVEVEPNLDLVQSLIDCLPLPACVIDCVDLSVTAANAEATGLLGSRVGDVTGGAEVRLAFVHPDDRGRVAAQLEAAETTGFQQFGVDVVRLLDDAGRCVAATVRSGPVGNPGKAPYRHVLAVFQLLPAQVWKENDCLTCSMLADCPSPHFAS